MKAYWIRSDERTITEVEYQGLPDLKRMVGGYIELAKLWPNGDTIYVDEHGRVKGGEPTFFHIRGQQNGHAGNGVLVGREIGDTARTAAPTIRLEQLLLEIYFLDKRTGRWVTAS